MHPWRRNTYRSSWRLTKAMGALTAVVLVTSACSVVVTGAERSMPVHAANTATVLENQPSSAYTTDAVRRVIGVGTDDTITVLAARGTLRDGFIELRIRGVTRPDDEFGSGSSATDCFDFNLDNVTHPDQVDCPDQGPKRLPDPQPVTTTTVS